MTDPCPNVRALSDAFARGDEALAAHAERCRSCGKEWSSLQEIRTVARAMPYRTMSPERIRSVRAQIVMATRNARPPANRSRAYAIAAALVMVALGFSSVWMRKQDDRPFLATVTSLSGARPRRVAMIEDGVRREVVTLLSGRMDVQVETLTPGERFLVVTDDAEVEVRGTRFEVEAREGLLHEVRVISGLVEVRPRERLTALLRTGERWIREEPSQARIVAPVAPIDPIVEKPIKAVKKVRKLKAPPARQPTAAERAFQEGWSLYREGRSKEAAAAFDRVIDLAPDTPLAEDANYWKEQALRSTEAW